MRYWSLWLPCFCALVLFAQLASTAPAESSDSVATDARPTASDHASTSASKSTTSTTASHATAAAAAQGTDTSRGLASTSSGSSSHSLVIPPTPSTHFPSVSWSRTRTGTFSHPHFTPSPGATTHGGGSGGGWRPDPAAGGTQGANTNRGGSQHGQSAVALAFEIIAGVAGVLIVASLGRCVYVYRRAPARDRLGAAVDRYRLQREMEELERGRMERSARALERYRWRPPPPPYQPAPEYDAVVQHPGHAADGDGSIDWGSPPRFSVERDRSPFASAEREGDRDGEMEAARLTQPSPTHSP